jgi:transcriptional regulator GlxA family with amidase domain
VSERISRTPLPGCQSPAHPPERNIDQIARQCGFGDEERMRFTFQRNLGISPRDYRNRFSR